MSNGNSPKAALVLSESDQKTLVDLKKSLTAQQNLMSEKDFAEISARIDNAIATHNALTKDGIKEVYSKKELSDIQSKITNAKSNFTLKAPVVQSANLGNPKAAIALEEVAKGEAKLEDEKIVKKEEILTETKPKVAALKTSVELSSAQTIAELKSKFDARLSFNDALAIVLKGGDELGKFDQNSAYSRDGNKALLEAYLDNNGYVTRTRIGKIDNHYSTQELLAVLELRDALKDENVRKKVQAQTVIQRSVKIDKTELGTENTKPGQLLADLLDFNGDGVLTAYNQKDRSTNLFINTFQKLTNGGKDTQMVISPELLAYQMLEKQVKTADDFYELVALRIGKKPEEVKTSWAIPEQRKQLIQEFRRKFLLEVAESNTAVAAAANPAEAKIKYKAEKVNEQMVARGEIEKSLKNGGMIEKIKAKIEEAQLPPLDAKDMDTLLGQTALRIYELNPTMFASIGANGVIERTTTNTTTRAIERTTHTLNEVIRDIRIVKDASGNVLSQTPTDRPSATTVTQSQKVTGEATTTDVSEKKSIKPMLVIGLNQDIFGYKGESTSARASVGASAVAGVDGIVFPITASIEGDYTAVNDNARLASGELKGNFVFGGMLSVSKPLGGSSNGVIPSLTLTANFDSKIDAMDKQEKRLENMLGSITLDKDTGFMNTDVLMKELDEMEGKTKIKNPQGPEDINTLSEITLMRKFLADTAEVLKNIPAAEMSLPPDVARQYRLQAIRNNMDAYKAAYKEALYVHNQGNNIAGVTLTFVPKISGIFLGLNVETIIAKARKTGVDTSKSTPMTLAEVTSEFGNILQDGGDKKSLVVGSSAIDGGIVTVLPGISMVDAVPGNSIVKRLIPSDGMRLQFSKMASHEASGVATRGIVISQVPAEKTEQKILRVQQGKSEADIKLPELLDKTIFNATEKQQIFVLSRQPGGNLSKSIQIVNKDNTQAEKLISSDAKLKFITDKLSGKSQDQKNRILSNVVLVSLGSSDLRDKENATNGQVIKEHEKNKSAFQRIFLGKGPNPESVQAYNALVNEMNKGLNKDKTAENSLISGLFNTAGYRGIAGTITLAQVGLDTKTNKIVSTARGLLPFSGDIRVQKVSAEVTDAQLKQLIINNTSSEINENLKGVNNFLKSQLKPEFSREDYVSYLKTGVLPKNLVGILDNTIKPKFIATRALIPGAQCANDVFAVAFPKVSILGSSAQETVSIESTEPIGNVISQVETYGGDSGAGVTNLSVGVIESMTNTFVQKGVDVVTDVATTGTRVTPGQTTTVVQPPVVPPPPPPGVIQNSTSQTGSHNVSGNSSQPATNAGSTTNTTVTPPVGGTGAISGGGARPGR